MKALRGFSLIVCLAAPLSAASIGYNNGGPQLGTPPIYAISGNVLGTISAVSDTFTIQTLSSLTLVQLAIWIPTGSTMTTLNYCISTASGCAGTVDENPASPTNLTLLSTVGTSGGFTLNEYEFNLQQQFYNPGTYWLQVDNANVNTGNAYWDTDNGTGCTPVGATACPSGAVWSNLADPIATQGSFTSNDSQSFDVGVGPEPSAFALMGLGLAVLPFAAKRLRRGRG